MSGRRQSVKAGSLYFIGVFVVGFAFGGIRMMARVLNVGETWAVLIESPFVQIRVGFSDNTIKD